MKFSLSVVSVSPDSRQMHCHPETATPGSACKLRQGEACPQATADQEPISSGKVEFVRSHGESVEIQS